MTLRIKTEGHTHTQRLTHRGVYTCGNKRKKSNFLSSFFFGNQRPHPLLRRHFRLSCLPGSLSLFFCPCRCFPMLRTVAAHVAAALQFLILFCQGFTSTEIRVAAAKTLLFFCAHNVVDKHQQSLPLKSRGCPALSSSSSREGRSSVGQTDGRVTDLSVADVAMTSSSIVAHDNTCCCFACSCCRASSVLFFAARRALMATAGRVLDDTTCTLPSSSSSSFSSPSTILLMPWPSSLSSCTHFFARGSVSCLRAQSRCSHDELQQYANPCN